MDRLSSVLDGFALGVEKAAPLEIHLRNAYYRTLNRLVQEAARNFARRASTHMTAAASQWGMPDRDEVLPEDKVKAALLDATSPIRTRIVGTMMGSAVGVGFDVTNPLAQHVLGQLGSRITEISELTRRDIMRSLADSHEKGLSIPHAARAMAKDVKATNITRSTLIARTEFIGAQNGSSLASIQATGAATYKTWLATNDERTRADHAEANGQTVPLQDVFDVGGAPMMYPGDQNAPAEEVCNCRCTITYGDDGGSAGAPSPMFSAEESSFAKDYAPDYGRTDFDWTPRHPTTDPVFRIPVSGHETTVNGIKLFVDDQHLEKHALMLRSTGGRADLGARGRHALTDAEKKDALNYQAQLLEKYTREMSDTEIESLTSVQIMGQGAPASMYGAMGNRVLATGGRGQMSWWRGSLDNEGTFYHEMGHIVGNRGGPVDPIGWLAAKDEDRSVAKSWAGKVSWSNQGRGGRGGHSITLSESSVTTYGATNIQEDWAESYRLWRASRGQAIGDTFGEDSREVTFADIWPARNQIFEEEFPDTAEQVVKERAGVLKRRAELLARHPEDTHAEAKAAVEALKKPPEKLPEVVTEKPKLGRAGRDEDIIARARAGESVSSIAARHGLSGTRVRRILKAAEDKGETKVTVEAPKPPKPPEPPKKPTGGAAERDQAIVSARQAGRSISDIAREQGLSTTRVRNILIREGAL